MTWLSYIQTVTVTAGDAVHYPTAGLWGYRILWSHNELFMVWWGLNATRVSRGSRILLSGSKRPWTYVMVTVADGLGEGNSHNQARRILEPFFVYQVVTSIINKVNTMPRTWRVFITLNPRGINTNMHSLQRWARQVGSKSMVDVRVMLGGNSCAIIIKTLYTVQNRPINNVLLWS